MMPTKPTSSFFNRELSWICFNQRVLAEAQNANNPLLERLKFVAITASNLTEFFMVRVGGLNMARREGRRKKDAAGLTPVSQLKLIKKHVREMYADLYACFNTDILPRLRLAGIRPMKRDELSAEQEAILFNLFCEELFPVITPLAVEWGTPWPLLHNLSLYMLVKLKLKKETCYAVMHLGRCGARFITLPSEDEYQFVLREEVAKMYVDSWFAGYTVEESVFFRVTRNADLAVQENEAPDLLSGMEEVLENRKTGDCIRLEVESTISDELLGVLHENIPAKAEDTYKIDGILNLACLMPLAFVAGFDSCKVNAWPPQSPVDLLPAEPMFEQIAQRDFLFYHPYESFDPVVRFIEEAAVDLDTIAIKMVLYRTSSDSSIITALKRAASHGINVTVLLELKARFDEMRNMDAARELELHGIQVIHGVKGYKTHAKICLVVRKEPTGIARYCHFGTGNYNESTAKLYGDISYLTSNHDLGADASAFFNALCGYSQPQDFNLLCMSPTHMRNRLLELIDIEIEYARKKKNALIMAKFNSLTDVKLINKLYEASNAGVSIRLNIRGICCLRPGVKGLSENIEVMSIVDRFLEHARIFYFQHGGKSKVFISSADWMQRNLDKRLELLIPIESSHEKKRLIDILKMHLSDTARSWELLADGTYCRILPPERKKPLRSQQKLYWHACEAVDTAAKKRRTRFEPHRPDA